jgi:hypothetical protein
MRVTRWALIPIAMLGAAALTFIASQPAETPLPSMPEPMAALPLVLPARPASEAIAGLAPRPAAPQQQTAASASTAPRVGSEGYGPHIERALAGNDAAKSWEAVKWLWKCALNVQLRSHFEALRDQGVAQEKMTQRMIAADADARRCQTVTAQHQALLAELAAQAMRGGVHEAASAYAHAASASDLSAAQRQEVAEAMRRDARAGDEMSLVNAATANAAWGLSDAERLTFLLAYGMLDPYAGGVVVEHMLTANTLKLAVPPTQEQLAAARQAAQQLVDRTRVGKPSRAAEHAVPAASGRTPPELAM